MLFSVLLRPPPASPLPQLSLVAGLAVAIALERETGARALLKWPNDVLVDGRKVAGMLLESSGASVVCGIGINVNQAESELPTPTRTPAVSLRIATGRPFDRGVLLAAVLGELEGRYADWLAAGLGRSRRPAGAAECAARAPRPRGRPVGRAGAIAPDGRLTIVLGRGDTVLVESGEVELA